MARISITNGFTTQEISTLTDKQVERAAREAANRGGFAYDEVDGQTFDSERDWLTAYCDAHERHYGQVFAAW